MGHSVVVIIITTITVTITIINVIVDKCCYKYRHLVLQYISFSCQLLPSPLSM